LRPTRILKDYLLIYCTQTKYMTNCESIDWNGNGDGKLQGTR